MNRIDAATTITNAINDNLFRYTPGARMTTAKMKRCVEAVNDQLPTPLRAYVIDHLFAEFNLAERWGTVDTIAAYVLVLNSHLSGAGYEGEPFTAEHFAAIG